MTGYPNPATGKGRAGGKGGAQGKGRARNKRRASRAQQLSQGRTRSRSSKANPDEPPAKWPTQPQVVGTVTLEGEAMSKDKASEFKCNVSLKRIQASDGSYIFKSDGDEGGEGEFDDDDEEEDDCKVEIADLNGDGDEGDAPNDRQTSKLDSKTGA